MVKACGYGSSSIEISKLLENLGIDYFARVKNIDYNVRDIMLVLLNLASSLVIVNVGVVSDGSFEQVMQGSTWLETWQARDPNYWWFGTTRTS